MKPIIPALLTAFIISGSLVLTAPAQNKDASPPDREAAKSDDTSDRPDRATEPVIELVPNPVDETDFIHKAAKDGAGELKIAELGVKRAQDEKVKECAQMLVKDHTASNEELKKIAESLKIRLDDTADPKVEKICEDLNLKKGRDFDKAFLQEMASGHEKGISLFEAGQKVSKEKQVTAFIDKTLPVLRNHAQKIAEIGGWETRPGPRPKPVVDPAPEAETKAAADRPGSPSQPGTNRP